MRLFRHGSGPTSANEEQVTLVLPCDPNLPIFRNALLPSQADLLALSEVSPSSLQRGLVLLVAAAAVHVAAVAVCVEAVVLFREGQVRQRLD